ncbi:MAG: hypothetical protein J5822_01375, partial [Eubacteriaceae bacterium]|nr:hypothetical protein [Eubacteriaceae bacterium]
KAHPVAPSPASALLSGVLTKAGVWGMIALCGSIFRDDARWGAVMLLLGCITMLLGALKALFSVDLKETLACSSMSQIGFIMTGLAMTCILGEENSLAARGVLLHMMNHSLIKLDLFLCAGAVFMNTHTLDLNRLRGWGSKKSFLKTCFLLGAAAIAGIPGFSGYISKTLLHEAIVEGAHVSSLPLAAAEWVFLISGGITLSYMLKLFVCIFTGEAGEKGKKYMGPAGYVSIGCAAALLAVLGLTPYVTMDGIASRGIGFLGAAGFGEAVRYFSFECLKGSLISVSFGGLIYLTVVRRLIMKDGKYRALWPEKLDLEKSVYRPLLERILPELFGKISSLFALNVLTSRLWNGAVRLSGEAAQLFAENALTSRAASGIFKLSSVSSRILSDNSISSRAALFVFRASSVLSHAMDDMLDALIYLLRKTVYRDLGEPVTDSVYLSMPYRVGHFIDRRLERHGRTVPGQNRYARLLVRRVNTIRMTVHETADSLSFALFMLVAAICVCLVYLLFLR